MRPLILSIGLMVSFTASLDGFAQAKPEAATAETFGRVSARERDALVALYTATDGAHWKNHEGWLGPPGTECDWSGVTCVPADGGKRTLLVELELVDNNLRGTIPGSIADLSDVSDLGLFGNHLSGKLPDQLIEKWLSGSMFLTADPAQLTDISEIDFESVATAVLCVQRRFLLRSDASVTEYSVECRNATPKDRTTYCAVKKGHVWWGEFARLALVLERNGFFGLEPQYSRNITHANFESTRVTKAAKVYEVVDYANGGPLSLWESHRAIEGAVSHADWDKTTRQTDCPSWDDSHPKAKNPR